MTISSVTSGGGQFVSLDSDSVEHGSFTSVAGEIALLMLETQESQKRNDREQLATAREDFSAALEDEVAALKAAADANFRGAMVQGSLSLASSGVGLWGEARDIERPWQDKASAGLDHLAQPVGAMVGKNYGAADAKSAEGVQTAAKWQMEDARESLKDADARQDQALDWVSSMVDREAATMTAILANKV